jgi:hypothetical protein
MTRLAATLTVGVLVPLRRRVVVARLVARRLVVLRAATLRGLRCFIFAMTSS